jgi:D-alanine-D-alanine ligase
MRSTSSSGSQTLRVVLLAGGRSSEHDVSLASAQAVREGLWAGGHEVLWIEIGRDGQWLWQGERLSVIPGGGLLGADVVFPVLHGPFGEDGVTQGLLETLDVPYVGAGVAASAVCMDKVLFKGLMASAGVPQVAYAAVQDERWRREPQEVLTELQALGLPVFVKPAHLGSSVGIVKVSEPDGLGRALDEALAHDELAIVEAMASGLEVECGVLGQPRAGHAEDSASALASEPGEIALPAGSDWYDYTAKYTDGGMELILPARISVTARKRVRQLAVDTFLHAGCDGLARVDFFVDGDEVLVNELNTMPGFTPTSVYAKLWQASGVDYPDLVERLCRLGLERHEARRAYRY